MPKSTLPSLRAGEPVPPFALTAVGSKREFSDATLVGRTSLLIFHDQHAQDEVQSLQERVRLQRPDHTDVFIASVVNMSVVPVFLRQIALGVMEKGYTGAKEHMPAGIDAADYVVILTDWDGKVCKRFGAERVDKAPLLVLLTPDGLVGGLYRGKALAEAAAGLLGLS